MQLGVEWSSRQSLEIEKSKHTPCCAWRSCCCLFKKSLKSWNCGATSAITNYLVYGWVHILFVISNMSASTEHAQRLSFRMAMHVISTHTHPAGKRHTHLQFTSFQRIIGLADLAHTPIILCHICRNFSDLSIQLARLCHPRGGSWISTLRIPWYMQVWLVHCFRQPFNCSSIWLRVHCFAYFMVLVMLAIQR